MKVLFIGDYKANTGPSNVNKNLKKSFPQNVCYIKNTFFLVRLLEIIIKSLFVEVIVISGFSRINTISIKMAKIFDKKIVYILHGCLSFENKINDLSRDYDVIIEEKYLNAAHCILCVSENFMYWFKEHYPQYTEKTSYLNNGIEWEILDSIRNDVSVEKEPNTIITMGGGRPQKNNVIICEAIKLLNSQRKNKLKFLVLGRDYRDTEIIKSYDFVDYIGQVDHDEAYAYLRRSQIFIQNSLFESFGLAPIEALMSGCDILISKNVGAICIMQSIQQSDIINDCTNPSEIAEKIEYLLNNTNNERLLSGINKNMTSWKYTADRLLHIIEELIKEKNQ